MSRRLRLFRSSASSGSSADAAPGARLKRQLLKVRARMRGRLQGNREPPRGEQDVG